MDFPTGFIINVTTQFFEEAMNDGYDPGKMMVTTPKSAEILTTATT